MKMTGAQIFVESLKREGVKVVWGYPGGVNLPEFDVLYDEKDLDVILVRHEQGATHAADGYARATGKPGVVLVTSGPGATNTVTGLATAYMDSVPLVLFCGQVSTSLIGNDAFQEADITGISRSCTKYNILVKDVKDLAQAIKEAFYIATTGRPGPVLVDLPKDVAQAKAEFHYPEKVSIRSYNPTVQGNKWMIKQAAEAISHAKKPILYVGGGVIGAGASPEIRELAEMTRIPVTMTLLGLGAFPGSHPLSLGMLGMHGSYATNMAVHNCDLLIAIGARFDDRVTGRVKDFVPYAKIIHVDIDPTSIRKNVNVDIPIVGDAKTVLRDLLAIVKPLESNATREARKPWARQIDAWQKERPLAYTMSNDDKVIRPEYVIDRLYALTEGKAIITTEVGQHQMWTAQFYKFDHPRTLITSGGLGTMGYGLPAAIGAQKAFPDKTVIDIAGDASIIMLIGEMATAVTNRLPVKVAIINNKYQGMVRQWQELFYNERYSSSYMGDCPDYVKLAEAFGATGLRATEVDQVDEVIRRGLATPGPVIMDFVVDPMANCYPMVPAGAAINEMLFEDSRPTKEEKEKAKEAIEAA